MRGAMLLIGALAISGPTLAGSETCLECHAELAQRPGTHPLGVPAPARLEGRLPTEGGRIACLTCHVPHGIGVMTAGAAPAPEAHLRAAPPALCAFCHFDRSGRWDHPHNLYADALHGGTRLALPIVGGGLVDPVSERCLACHDGAQAAAAPHTIRVTGQLGESHPIGVPVRVGWHPHGAMRPVEEIESRGVRLFDGRVGCGSCHRLYARRRGLPAAPFERSELCFSCHAM